MVTPTSKYGPSRLLAFKLGGQQPFPQPLIQIPEVPRPPENTYTPAQIKRGEALKKCRPRPGTHPSRRAMETENIPHSSISISIFSNPARATS